MVFDYVHLVAGRAGGGCGSRCWFAEYCRRSVADEASTAPPRLQSAVIGARRRHLSPETGVGCCCSLPIDKGTALKFSWADRWPDRAVGDLQRSARSRWPAALRNGER